MYNTHLEFHSQSDDQTRLLQTSVWLAAVLDRSAGQQNSGLFILLMYPVRILTQLRCRLVKFDRVGGPVMACSVYTDDRHGDTTLLYAYPVSRSRFICHLAVV